MVSRALDILEPSQSASCFPLPSSIKKSKECLGLMESFSPIATNKSIRAPIKAYARRVLATKRQRKLGSSLVAAKIARVTYAIMRHPAPYSAVAGNPEVANKKLGSMSKVSRYAIRRAEHCLRRVSAVEGLGSKITQDAIELARALEEAIGQNGQVL